MEPESMEQSFADLDVRFLARHLFFHARLAVAEYDLDNEDKLTHQLIQLREKLDHRFWISDSNLSMTIRSIIQIVRDPSFDEEKIPEYVPYEKAPEWLVQDLKDEHKLRQLPRTPSPAKRTVDYRQRSPLEDRRARQARGRGNDNDDDSPEISIPSDSRASQSVNQEMPAPLESANVSLAPLDSPL